MTDNTNPDNKSGFGGILGQAGKLFESFTKQSSLGGVLKDAVTTPEGQEALKKIASDGLQIAKKAAGELAKSAEIALLEARLNNLKKPRGPGE